MTPQTKIYIAVTVAVMAAGILGWAAWSNHKIATLENAVERAKKDADKKEERAAAKEIEAAEYKQKIEYLEQQLSEIQIIARRQDEELEKLNINSGGARVDARRARSTRSIAANADELCAKLAEIGHPCG